MADKYGAWTVKELKNELKNRNARCTGKKEDLIERLSAYDRNNNFILVDSVTEYDTESELISWPSEDFFTTVKQTSDIPPIDIGHINQYFFNMASGSAGITMCASVQRRGYAMMKENFILALIESKANYYFYRGQVNSEVTKNLTYFIRLAVNFDGNIVESHCECISGKGPKAVCKHIATVGFAILHFREHGAWRIRSTCTDNKQIWHMPKKSRLEISPKKAENITFAVPTYNVKKKKYGNMCYDPRPQSYRNMPTFNAYVRNMTINYTSTKKRTLGISSCYTPASVKDLCHDHDYLNVSLEHQIISNRIQVTEVDAKKIEQKTRQQSNCPAWHQERALRVTASKVGTIMNMTERRNKYALAENIVYPKKFRSIYTEHGKANEKNAIAHYEEKTTNSVVACGLFISPEHPYLAGSPDGLVAKETVLEVKCPFSIKDQSICAANVPYVEYKNGTLSLKTTCEYYYQVQTQMFVTNRNYCDFVIWTNCDYKCLSVERNNSLINKLLLPTVKDFYDTYMVPVLYKKFYN